MRSDRYRLTSISEDQDRQCTHKITLRLFRVTFCSGKAVSTVLHVLSACLYSCLMYPACKVHTPYYIVFVACPAVPYCDCGLSGCTIL